MEALKSRTFGALFYLADMYMIIAKAKTQKTVSSTAIQVRY